MAFSCSYNTTPLLWGNFHFSNSIFPWSREPRAPVVPLPSNVRNGAENYNSTITASNAESLDNTIIVPICRVTWHILDLGLIHVILLDSSPLLLFIFIFINKGRECFLWEKDSSKFYDLWISLCKSCYQWSWIVYQWR